MEGLFLTGLIVDLYLLTGCEILKLQHKMQSYKWSILYAIFCGNTVWIKVIYLNTKFI